MDQSSDHGSLYEHDFHEWLLQQAALLRERRFSELDLENLIEEVEDLAWNLKRSIASNLRVLLVHLLKWRHQPDKRKGGWESSIIEHRARVVDDLELGPSLKPRLAEFMRDNYDVARRRAAAEMRIPVATLPRESPFSAEDLLNSAFLPEAVEEA